MVYFTLAEIAEILGVNIETVRRWARKKSQPRLLVHNTNRGHIVSEADLQRFLEAKGFNYEQSLFPIFAKDKPTYDTPPTIIGSSIGPIVGGAIGGMVAGGKGIVGGLAGAAGAAGAAAGRIISKRPKRSKRQMLKSITQKAPEEQPGMCASFNRSEEYRELTNMLESMRQEIRSLHQRVKDIEEKQNARD